MARAVFVFASLIALLLIGAAGYTFTPFLWAYALALPVIALGVVDMTQPHHAIRRNFPVIGNLRYFFESIRPEMHQYFIETDHNGTPFSREQRSVVYQRAKDQLDTTPFGTRHDVYAEGYQWIEHSLNAHHAPAVAPRITIGGPDTPKPYAASLLNVGAMSYGSLSSAAVLALNGGAKDGGFAHNTGEGGLSPYHLENGGDVIWQLGTGYFGARSPEGGFSPDEFAKRAVHEHVKMIEVKLSQGAKPGHGGILPAGKVTPEIAAIRNVPMGVDVLSPPSHSAFQGPTGLLEFISELRSLSGGKPVGFKLCVGKRREFYSICKAMLETGITPDFITVDGGEGGTGAAPLEFSNAIGWPLFDGLNIVHGALRGVGLRDRITLISSGRVIDGFDMAVRLSLGADLCYSARAMMFSLGCIQALRCNNNSCPTGVATQDPALMRGLVVADKRKRVYNYHRKTVHNLLEIVAAAGLEHPRELHAGLIHRRISGTETNTLDTLYRPLDVGSLVAGIGPEDVLRDWAAARAERF